MQPLARPVGDGFVWATGEAAEIAAVRSNRVARWGLANGQIRAASDCKRGAASFHGVINR